MNVEQQAEFDYLVQERLGILCGASEPTREQLDLAEREARLALSQASGETSS
jgi:hypothetical protein